MRAFALDVLCAAPVDLSVCDRYADLFWALQGGGGQFGIVTTFYQEAAPEPTQTDYAVYIFDDEADLVCKWAAVAGERHACLRPGAVIVVSQSAC